MSALGWAGIARLGLVQAAIGAMVMLSTTLLNRVMVVEYALPAALPAALVAWHYAVQLSRPAWGHGSDRGGRRTPWIVGGLAVLATGTVVAALTTLAMPHARAAATLVAVVAYAAIGGGVGAAGTSLLALLATRVAPERRAAAAAATWILMVAGIVVTAGIAGSLLDPFSPASLVAVVAGVAVVALVVGGVAVLGMEGCADMRAVAPAVRHSADFRVALAEMWADADARRFTVFVFVSMLAYAMQEMIVEPFAGLVFALTPGQSTHLAGMQHGGVLLGMLIVGIGGSAIGGGRLQHLRAWTVAGCLGSGAALVLLAIGAGQPSGWPLGANVALLGFCNGMFAVAAIAAMMALAGRAGPERSGIRMGAWGAAQALAFGAGGLSGAAGVDLLRATGTASAPAFATVFAVEAVLFVAAAALAVAAVGRVRHDFPQGVPA